MNKIIASLLVLISLSLFTKKIMAQCDTVANSCYKNITAKYISDGQQYRALLLNKEVAEKIIRHSEALGGISRFTFQMDAGLTHKKLMKAIELIGTKVIPHVNS